MTRARRERKRPGVGIAAIACLLCPLLASPHLLHAATTERLITDWHTGLAIDGYDPVAFYTEGEAKLGSPDVELSYGGAVWRFRNVGNRAAFAANPEVYMPQFGGYDPLGVGRGVAVAGNPSVWTIAGGRLFLFYDRQRLEMFMADTKRFIAAADRRWPELLTTLSP
jgi:hypothetical protein